MTSEKYGCEDEHGSQQGPLFDTIDEARAYARAHGYHPIAYTFGLLDSELVEEPEPPESSMRDEL